MGFRKLTDLPGLVPDYEVSASQLADAWCNAGSDAKTREYLDFLRRMPVHYTGMVVMYLKDRGKHEFCNVLLNMLIDAWRNERR